MSQAGPLTAYVHAMLVHKGMVINGSFETELDEITYRGHIYLGTTHLEIKRDALIMHRALPMHTLSALAGTVLCNIIEMPECGIDPIDHALKTLVIKQAVQKEDDRGDQITEFEHHDPETRFDIDFCTSIPLYSGDR